VRELERRDGQLYECTWILAEPNTIHSALQRGAFKCQVEMIKESIHSEKGGKREIFFKSSANLNWTTVG
jgi:hypothetical protein